MIDLGFGVARTDGVYYRDTDPQATYVIFDNTTALLVYLRSRFGDFVLDVTEGLMAEAFRFTVYQRPF
jgi:hypothetical protein